MERAAVQGPGAPSSAVYSKHSSATITSVHPAQVCCTTTTATTTTTTNYYRSDGRMELPQQGVVNNINPGIEPAVQQVT